MPHPCRRSLGVLLLLSPPALACCVLSPIVDRAATGDSQQAAPSLVSTPGRVTVALRGLGDRHGWLRVSLYNRPGGFPDVVPVARRDVALAALTPATLPDSLTVTFTGLPSGTYAVCAFHDRDGNGRQRTADPELPGHTAGGVGHVRQPAPRFRAPRFHEASFPLKPAEEKTVVLMLRR